MKLTIEYWSLLIATIALLSSVGLPLYLRKMDTKEKISDKRTLLLQKILSVKSINNSSRMQLSFMLQRYGDRMSNEQRQEIVNQTEVIKVQENETWELHALCSNYDDGATLQTLDNMIKSVAVTESEAIDMANTIEKRINTYE